MKRLLYLLPLLAVACTEAGNMDDVFSFTLLPPSTFTATCQSATGHCFYLIAKSFCNEEFLTTGQKKRTCHISPFLEFNVDSGQSRTIAQVPADFQYCMSVESSPVLGTCIGSPLPH
jgi:hypothetical protein